MLSAWVGFGCGMLLTRIGVWYFVGLGWVEIFGMSCQVVYVSILFRAEAIQSLG